MVKRLIVILKMPILVRHHLYIKYSDKATSLYWIRPCVILHKLHAFLKIFSVELLTKSLIHLMNNLKDVFWMKYLKSVGDFRQWLHCKQDGVEHRKTLGHFRSVNTNMTNHHQNLQEYQWITTKLAHPGLHNARSSLTWKRKKHA